jgi:hypothetical protein
MTDNAISPLRRRMIEDMTKTFGVGEAERRLLVRMDSAKVNIAPRQPRRHGSSSSASSLATAPATTLQVTTSGPQRNGRCRTHGPDSCHRSPLS